MTIAEIRGKISRSGSNISDRSEDLLTSDVFTACKYTHPGTLCVPFLGRAKNITGNNLSELINEKVIRADYVFWPFLNQSQPDVLIMLKLLSKKVLVLMVEAKYYSDKSSGPLSEEELVAAEAPHDQLAREYADLLNKESMREFGISLSSSQAANSALIYITAHRSMPTDSLIESINEIKNFVGKEKINIFWLSWFDLYTVISNTKKCFSWEKPILYDLQCLVERKRLVKFKGFHLGQINIITEDSIYRKKSKDTSAGYRFKLFPESYYRYPVFYFSKRKIESITKNQKN